MALKREGTIDDELGDVPASAASGGVPWAIWIVVFMLGLEGLGNLLAIPHMPRAAGWLAFKCLAIVGLIRGWRVVYVLVLVVGVQHVVGFGVYSPFVALLNLVMVVLVAISFRHFFPHSRDGGPPGMLKPRMREVSGWDADA